MKKILAVWLMLSVTSAHADDLAQVQTLLAQPLKSLAGAQQVRGSFVQLRALAGMSKPLKSTGRFAFVRDLGVLWETQAPFASTLVLTPQGLHQRDAGGGQASISAQQQPGLKAAAATLLSLFSLDLQGLSSQFELAAQPEGKGWQLALKPRSAALASAVGTLAIHGAAQIERIEVTDPHGDRTTLSLTGVKVSAQAPTAAERAPFAAQ